MSIGQTFDSTVEYYDEWMRIALPNYTELFAVSVDLIPFATEAAIDVLDLGAGTGLFSMHVREKLTRARFVLYDLAPRMLDVAEFYWKTWLDRVRRSGAAEDRIQAAVERRTRYDKDALMTDQVEWLREAGFNKADCVFKSFFIGVFHGMKI
jgi:tRNA (cmo5U34)-methyltransferase